MELTENCQKWFQGEEKKKKYFPAKLSLVSKLGNFEMRYICNSTWRPEKLVRVDHQTQSCRKRNCQDQEKWISKKHKGYAQGSCSRSECLLPGCREQTFFPLPRAPKYIQYTGFQLGAPCSPLAARADVQPRSTVWVGEEWFVPHVKEDDSLDQLSLWQPQADLPIPANNHPD